MSRILILSGEASGELHGSALATALKKISPDIELEGIGGPKMEAAGVRLLTGLDKLDIMGIPSWPELRRALAVLKKLSLYIKSSSFDAIVLIDNPGLNLRLARVARDSGHRVIYYIAPQTWAWREGRIKKLRRNVDKVLSILPFEEAYFRKAGVDCDFIGNPIMDEVPISFDVAGLRTEFGLESTDAVVGFLPGSRKGEVERLLPAMLGAGLRLLDSGERAGRKPRFILARAASVPLDLIESLIRPTGLPVTIIPERAYDVIAVCDALIVTSGTATLQTALVGRPMSIVYRISELNYHAFKWVVKARWMGLANLIAGRLMSREFLQKEVTGERLADATAELLTNPKAREQAETDAAELRAKLGGPGVSNRAAARILELIGGQRA